MLEVERKGRESDILTAKDRAAEELPDYVIVDQVSTTSHGSPPGSPSSPKVSRSRKRDDGNIVGGVRHPNIARRGTPAPRLSRSPSPIGEDVSSPYGPTYGSDEDQSLPPPPAYRDCPRLPGGGSRDRLGERSATRSPSCLLYTSPSPRDRQKSRMPSSA